MKDKPFNEHEAAEFCGIDPKYFRNLRRTGRGPAFVRPSPHTTLYRLSDLKTWRDSWITAAPTTKQDRKQEI